MEMPLYRIARHCIALASLIVAVMAISACDRNGDPIEEFGLDKLQKGVSTETEVRTIMGQPATVWDDGDGARTLEYPKGPEGIRTWMFAINAMGTMIDYRQVLTDENFAKVVPNLSQEEVRRMLGRPRNVVTFKRKHEEVWDWKYHHVHEDRLFNVHFDMTSQQVVGTSFSDISGH